jgi:hypothetical protein
MPFSMDRAVIAVAALDRAISSFTELGFVLLLDRIWIAGVAFSLPP